jgi:hypothetical protein
MPTLQVLGQRQFRQLFRKATSKIFAGICVTPDSSQAGTQRSPEITSNFVPLSPLRTIYGCITPFSIIGCFSPSDASCLKPSPCRKAPVGSSPTLSWCSTKRAYPTHQEYTSQNAILENVPIDTCINIRNPDRNIKSLRGYFRTRSPS